MKKRSPELPAEIWANFKEGQDLFQAVFSSVLEQKPEAGKAHKEVWRRALRETRKFISGQRTRFQRANATRGKDEGWSRHAVEDASQRFDQYFRQALDEADRIEEKIENSSAAELMALGDAMKHKAHLVGRVPGQAITAIDLNSSLKVSDSTTIMLNHDRAYERGTFEETETFPQADIGGRIGKSDVSGLLQLRPAGQDAAEAQVMADRLRDPKEAVGVRAAQISRFLLSIWSSSKDAEGMATVTINQLAEELRFTADDDGGFSGITYQRIREAVRFLEAGYSRIAGGERSRVAFESAMWSFTRISVVEGEVDTFRDDWTTLRFRPEWAHARLLEGEKTYLMGRDHELNKLDPIRQRYEQRLCVWIEEQLRFNWDREPGLIRRKARTLLNEGMGFDADVSRRDKKLIDKLFRALAVAEQKGTIEQWEPDDGWVIKFHMEMQTPRSKCRESDWRRFLDSSFQLFAGTKYEQYYANHGAARITDGLVAALNELIREGHSQVLVAKEIGISASALSQFRSGKSGLKPKTREALEQYLARQGKPFQGELPLLDL